MAFSAVKGLGFDVDQRFAYSAEIRISAVGPSFGLSVLSVTMPESKEECDRIGQSRAWRFAANLRKIHGFDCGTRIACSIAIGPKQVIFSAPS